MLSPMSLGSDVKSLTGTGIFFTMYSQTTSMLYFSCAEMGMMGAPSATVPEEKHDAHPGSYKNDLKSHQFILVLTLNSQMLWI